MPTYERSKSCTFSCQLDFWVVDSTFICTSLWTPGLKLCVSFHLVQSLLQEVQKTNQKFRANDITSTSEHLFDEHWNDSNFCQPCIDNDLSCFFFFPSMKAPVRNNDVWMSCTLPLVKQLPWKRVIRKGGGGEIDWLLSEPSSCLENRKCAFVN